MKLPANSLRFVRRAVPVVVGLVVLVAVIAWLAGTFEPKIAPDRSHSTAAMLTDQPTGEVHEVIKDYIEEAVGTLKAASRTIVSAKILATIVEVSVAAGDQVSQGDVLLRLSSEELGARLKQAEQALLAAQASRAEAESAFARAERLRQTSPGTLTQAEFDQTSARVQVARADERRYEQAVNEAEVLLSYTTITAPRSGRIVDRLAEPGDTARPGEPLLVLYDATSLRLEAPVVEHLAVTLVKGQKLEVRIDALDRTVEAVVDEIVPQAEAPSRSFLVKAAVPYADNLYEGMFGRLLIPAGQRRHLCLPTDAIQRLGQLEFVEVIRPDDTLERRFIRTGRLGMPGKIEVLSGVAAGERVVLHPPSASRAPQPES